MLKSLMIKNLATIDSIQLEFQPGFSVLTGETGAGKSIVIGGLRLVLGSKASTDVIRTGEKDTFIEAVFKSNKDVLSPGKDLGGDDGNEIFLQRIISLSGSGKGYCNGILVPVKNLREIGNDLVDIYGQNDHIFLLRLDRQLDYLDQFAECLDLRSETSRLAQGLRRLIKEKDLLKSRERERAQRLDFLQYQIQEIEAAGLFPGEEEEIREKRSRLIHSEKIQRDVHDALELTYQSDDSILSRLPRLQAIVRELQKFDDSLKNLDQSLDEITLTLKEFVEDLIQLREKQGNAESKLEEIEQRLSQIENLKRKYGSGIVDILNRLELAKQERQELLEGSDHQKELERKIQAAFNDYRSSARKLSQQRLLRSNVLKKKIEEEIAYLGMARARFQIKIASNLPAGPDSEMIHDKGIDEVEFLISPNPGEELKPLRKIASGGELSRLMLALKSVGGGLDQGNTFVFDEIDAGIGGKTAEFVARKLQELSLRNQIICITHLPQIASFARHHYKIEKQVQRERTFTTVKKLEPDERAEEIARLSAGSRITGTALKNAQEMLERNLAE